MSIVNDTVSGTDATVDDYKSIALHFENEKNHFMAGKFFLFSQQYSRVSIRNNSSSVSAC